MGFFGDVFGGKTKSTQTTAVQFTREQKELIEKQLELADFQLAELERQRETQETLFDPAKEQAQEFESQLSEFTGAATPEQEELIDEAIRNALQAGESDISRFQSQATEQLREELAPSLGLRTGDTPILDRGSRIAAEAVRQQGQLVSKLGLGRATSMLEFPMAIQDFQSQLRSRAFANRLQLAQNRGTIGLGLAGMAPNVGAVLGNVGSTGVGTTKDPARGFSLGMQGVSDLAGGIGGLMGGIAAMSSREAKENNRPVGEVLEKLDSLPVERWTYKGEEGEHIGPYAEDFREMFGIGDGVHINLMDALGVALAAIKELSAKVDAHA